MLSVITLVLGVVQTNTYLVADPSTREAVVIDPAWEGEKILAEANQRDWQIKSIWITHAHFDHIGGVVEIVEGCKPSPPVALHPADKWLWQTQGNASLFGLKIKPGPVPSIDLSVERFLWLGKTQFEVRHVPGHTPGHVVFYSAENCLAFCGDVIFQGSIGRTDLPGGDYDTLIQHIQDQILSMPNETRLLSGHGPETSVGFERANNPFLTYLA